MLLLPGGAAVAELLAVLVVGVAASAQRRRSRHAGLDLVPPRMRRVLLRLIPLIQGEGAGGESADLANALPVLVGLLLLPVVPAGLLAAVPAAAVVVSRPPAAAVTVVAGVVALDVGGVGVHIGPAAVEALVGGVGVHLGHAVPVPVAVAMTVAAGVVALVDGVVGVHGGRAAAVAALVDGVGVGRRITCIATIVKSYITCSREIRQYASLTCSIRRMNHLHLYLELQIRHTA